MDKKQVNIEKIIEMYNEGYSMMKIGQYFGYKSYGPIRKVLKDEGFNLTLRIGSNNRKHKLDETFFDNIDTPDKAYVLGWVISDGYVTKNKLVFGLKDLDILEKIKSIMKSEHKISEDDVYDKRTKKTYRNYRLQIASKKLAESLHKLGIHQAKSFTVDLPEIPKELYSHLIRGIFDGDGYIGIRTNKKGIDFPKFSMIVSEILYNKLEPIFNELGINFVKPSLIAEKNNNKILKIHINRKNELRLLFNYMYNNTETPKLDRKYQIFKKALINEDPIWSFKVNKFSLDGILLDSYKSIRSAAKDSKINHNTLTNNIIKQNKKEYEGFIWMVENP